jgi:hypothetical protein
MKNKALSPYISTALVILIGITALSLSLTILTPALNKAKDSAIINEAFNNLDIIDSTIREVASESVDSKRTINLKVIEGTYRVDSTNNFINFTYRMKEGLQITGQRDNVNITISAKDIILFIKYTNVDLQGSDHFTTGDNSIVILHNGTNSTTNYPLIYVGR